MVIQLAGLLVLEAVDGICHPRSNQPGLLYFFRRVQSAQLSQCGRSSATHAVGVLFIPIIESRFRPACQLFPQLLDVFLHSGLDLVGFLPLLWGIQLTQFPKGGLSTPSEGLGFTV